MPTLHLWPYHWGRAKRSIGLRGIGMATLAPIGLLSAFARTRPQKGQSPTPYNRQTSMDGMMGTFLFLATAEATEGGFGLNIDLLETNLINLVIIIVVLFYFGRNFLGKILTERRAKIEAAIQEAQQRQKEAAAALAEQQQKLAQAQAEAEKIRKAAEGNASRAREAILAKATQDVATLKTTAGRDVETEREKAIAELRQRVAAMAMQQVESQLRSQLDEGSQQQLVDRSIALLGGS